LNTQQQIAPITNSIDLEQGLLGACLTYREAMASVSGMLEPEHFLEPFHAELWRVMLNLQRVGRIVNPVTVGTLVPDIKLGGSDVNTRQYIAHLCAETSCPPVAAPDFAKQVRTAWAARQTLNLLESARAEILSVGYNTRSTILDLMQKLDETRAAIEPRNPGLRSAGALATAVIERAAAHYSEQRPANVVTTGVADLDRLLNGGFAPGELIILAGRPGMGKSIAAVSFSEQGAIAGHPGCIYSLEMTLEQIGSRYLSASMFGQTKLTSNQILYGRFSEQDFEKVADAAKGFADLPLHFDDSSSLSVGEISARTRTAADRFARAGKQLRFVFIDYLKFVKASDRYRGQRHYEVAEISSGLKELAKDLNIAVVLLAQLNREVEKREDKRPQLSDLRESGDLEADADKVIMLFREEYYHANRRPSEGDGDAMAQWMARADEIHGKIELLVEKNRMGPTGKVEAFCDVGASVIRDLRHTDRLPEIIA
jgi:replicative DNA helicase